MSIHIPSETEYDKWNWPQAADWQVSSKRVYQFARESRWEEEDKWSQIEVWPIYKLNEDFSKHIFFECRLAKSSGDCLNRNSSSNFSILIDGIRELG
ncbi:hypothetical protein GW17_00021170 [Ensete ventricosum]|nr:hypothetical protein GW17_00021170 [Ensete ventricosum]